MHTFTEDLDVENWIKNIPIATKVGYPLRNKALYEPIKSEDFGSLKAYYSWFIKHTNWMACVVESIKANAVS